MIGVGSLGQHHARILASLPEAHLTAVVDRDGDRSKEIGSRHAVPALTDIGDLPDDLDAVTVAVPTVSHAEVVGSCLDRGWSVLVEKPMAASLAEAEALVAAGKRSGRLLVVGHTERFNPAVRAVAARVRDPRFIEAHRLGAFTARGTDVDVVLDLMIHDLDIILSLVPSEVESIDAVGVNALTDKPDIANARIRFANGCVANVTASRISSDRVRKLRIFESDKYISIDYARQAAVSYCLKNSDRGSDIHREEVDIVVEEPLLVELRSFLRRIRGEEVPVVSAEDGYAALRAAFQVLERMGGVPGRR